MYLYILFSPFLLFGFLIYSPSWLYYPVQSKTVVSKNAQIINLVLLKQFQYYLLITMVSILSSAVFCSILLFFKYSGNISHSVVYFDFFSWILIDSLKIQWTLVFDFLTLVMLIVVMGISFLVHCFSMDYMKTDPFFERFLSYLSLFTFFMLILITGNNFFQLFIGWEGVGLCSYLLINFWSTRILANKAAIKAILINKIGDCGLLLALGLIVYTSETLHFDIFFAVIKQLVSYSFYSSYFIFNTDVFTLIGLFLLIGVMGKSAQFGLHSWLPDAMEGPTPVSALIHAATMVTAGVFLLIRCSHLFELLPLVTDCVLYVGGFTAFFAGTIGLFQSDLKKVIAYSTCSQLGYMVLCCGLSFYNLSLFHLFNHAFFKALLFLSAGSVIHALNDEQDFRKLGGLFRFLPVTYLTFFIGTLSLLGFPFLTGYYSKDLIFEYCLFQVYSLEVGFSVLDQTWRNLYLTTSTLSVAFYFFYLIFFSKNFALLSVFGVIILTAMYSWRVFRYTFLGSPNGFRQGYAKLSENEPNIIIVLVILSVLSIIIGQLFQTVFLGLGSNLFKGSFYSAPTNNAVQIFVKSELLTTIFLKYCPLVGMFLGIVFFLKGFYFIFQNYVLINCWMVKIYTFFYNRWFIDKIINHGVLQGLQFSLKIIYRQLDKGFIEYFGPFGGSLFFYFIGGKVSKWESGKLIVTFSFILLFLFWFFYFFSLYLFWVI